MAIKKFYLEPEQFIELKAEELEFINQHCDKPEKEDKKTRLLTGLALSGGGIRSAIFNLGVMQALAKHGVLNKIDYLSTVSGGGYIGSSLTWFLSQDTQKDFESEYPDQNKSQSDKYIFGTSENNFPYGTDEPGCFVTGKNSQLQKHLLNYIRSRGNYLTPGDNYTLFTLIAVALRTGMLSLMTWVPLISLIMLILMVPDIAMGSLKAGSIPVLFKWLGILGVLAALGFAFTGIFMAFFISLNISNGNDDESFKYRLRADKYSNALLNAAIVLIGIYLIAWFGTEVATAASVFSAADVLNNTSYIISLASIFMGIGTGLFNLFRPDSQLTNKVLLPIAAGLLGFGILLCSYHLSYATVLGYKTKFYGITLDYNSLFFGITFRWDYFLFLGILIALFLCVRTNLNDISIARFYRDRLKETFMPNAESLIPGSPLTFSKEAYLKDMCHSFGESYYQGPYHIINTNIILIDSKQKKYSRRGGDNFILSPLYCGSTATGWRETSNFFNGELTLATAMASSGAAVNPHSGVSGQGITRNRLVAFALSILNLRLGVWCPNPDPDIKVFAKFHPGNFLQSAWYGIKSWVFQQGYHEKAACIQITDGGHFENLGVYELIRRELDLIIVSDASADASFTFANFRNALRLVESDLDVEISLDANEKLSNLIPNKGDKMDLPMAEAEKGYLCATVHYKNNKTGRLVFLKSTMTGGQSIRTKSYKLEYPSFPDQPTSDQFFDESQFAAYQDLGYTITCDMLKNCDLTFFNSH